MRHVLARWRWLGIRRRLYLQWTVALLACFFSTSPFAAQPAEPELVVDGLGLPVDMVPSPDEIAGFFVVDLQAGRIEVVQDRERRPTPFLELPDRGPLSLAFAPDFPRQPYAFVVYLTETKDMVLSRFDVDTTSLVAIPQSEIVVLTSPDTHRHPCGDATFGPLDHFLYMCFGDPEPLVDTTQGAQTPDSLKGKIIRIDVSNISADEPYVVPSDNPFTSTGGDAIRPEIWAYGLRNPWRFTFDPTDGTMYIPDVGNDHWEELNVVSAADSRSANFGWPLSEGNYCISECVDTITWPIIDYPHLNGQCAIIGGAVYEGDKPDWHGVYVFGDYCGGTLSALRRRDNAYQVRELLGAGSVMPTAIGTDSEGEVLVADGAAGSVYRLQLPDDADDGWESVDSLLLRNQTLEKRSGFSLDRDLRERMENSRRWRWTQWLVQLYRSAMQPFE
jgi:glucose/arabinose dehydrogenase